VEDHDLWDLVSGQPAGETDDPQLNGMVDRLRQA
jgi:hypothetical protein